MEFLKNIGWGILAILPTVVFVWLCVAYVKYVEGHFPSDLQNDVYAFSAIFAIAGLIVGHLASRK